MCSEQAKHRAGWNVEPHSRREGLRAGRGLEAGKFGGIQLPLRKPLHTCSWKCRGAISTKLPRAGGQEHHGPLLSALLDVEAASGQIVSDSSGLNPF